MKSALVFSPEVAAALASNSPIVALESTIISHGLPRPSNLNVAREVEAIVREHGATPATIAILDGAVTQAKASNMLLPAGAIMAFAMNGAPTGWLGANGSVVSRTTYANLFTAIGTTYGAGDGSTTFQLPDLRGYFVRGVGVAGQNGANGDGTVSDTFGVKQADEIKSHNHSYFSAFYPYSSLAVGGGANQYFFANQENTTGATGGTETRPKNIAMLYCIKI